MAELVDAPASNSGAEMRVGSSPTEGTTFIVMCYTEHMPTESYLAYLATKPIRRGDLVRILKCTGYNGHYARVDRVDNLTAIATVRIKYSTIPVHINNLELVAQGWNLVGKTMRIPGSSKVCRW